MPEQPNGEILNPMPGSLGESPQQPTSTPEGDRPANPPPPAVEPMWALIKRLPKYARLSTAIVRDPRVSNKSKAMLVAGGIYLVSPIDLVPGIIPVAGQLDDLYVVLVGLQQAIRTSPADVIDEHFATIGLARTSVDEDLAEIRLFVQRGVAWSLVKGGQAISRLSKQATSFAQRARQRGEISHDQKPL